MTSSLSSFASPISSFAALGRLWRLSSADFAQAITDEEVLDDLQDLLEPETGRIDRVFEVTIEGDTLTGKAAQRISLGRSQTLQFTVSEGAIEYRLIDADEAAAFAESDQGWAEITEFAAKGKGSRAGKKLNCRPGNVQCGGKCQDGKKNCRVSPSPQQQAAASAVVKKAKAATPPKGKGKAKSAAPDADTQTSKPIDTPNRFKPKPFNPFARKDMTPDEFDEFRLDRELLKDNDNPSSITRRTYDQWKADQDNPRTATRARYRQDVMNAMRTGFDVPDNIAADLKLNKRDQALLQQNRADMNDRRARVAEIQQAIDYPLVEPDVAARHRPTMTPDEARRYAADSFMGDISFYHGNRTSVTDSIANDGSMPEKNDRGLFGQGTYFAIDRDDADIYAGFAYTDPYARTARGGAPPDVAVLENKVRVRNPYVTTSSEFSRIADEATGSFGAERGTQMNGIDSPAVTEYMRARGYDSIYLKDYGYMVSFDGRQSIVVANDRLADGDDRLTQAIGRQLDGLNVAAQRVSTHPDGSQLLNVQNSEDN